MKKSDAAIYVLGIALGLSAGILDLKIGDLLLTALFVLCATMLLGALRPDRAWRWTLLVAVFVPALHLLAYALLKQRPDRAHIYESLLGCVTGIAGSYGGAFGRRAVTELFK